MALPPVLFAAVLLLSHAAHLQVAATATLPQGCAVPLSGGPKRAQFPRTFVFGTATSAYQVEGAASVGGKGKSIWDKFAHTPGKIVDGSTGDVAVDQYNKYPADIKMMQAMGIKSYRFSIAWTRILPQGAGIVSKAGVAYYSRLINALIAAGITPVATLYHWDMPQALEDKYGGWLNAQSVKDFAFYARMCFFFFGSRVKTWITINEPQQIVNQGYGSGGMAPGRCSDRSRCPAGNSATEPYIVGHHLLLAHASAVREYRRRFQAKHKGRIGITLDCTYQFPFNPNSASDRAAAQRGNEFQYAWFADPVLRGRYPPSMVRLLGSRLPKFTPMEAALLIRSADFLGLNFYTASFASQGSPPNPGSENPYVDSQIAGSAVDYRGKSIGAPTGSPWLRVAPTAIYAMLKWVNARYPRMPIIITENGVSQDSKLPLSQILCDKQRVSYFQTYLSNVLRAIREGVPVQGYYSWSLLDNFEWAAGYTQRFGIHYVDFTKPGLPRTPKASAVWWSRFLHGL